VDSDNRRHPFPNANVYFSWFSDFSAVETVSAEVMASIPLGSNVVMRPGTWMIKIQTDPRVYVVEPYGVIRWIETEADAEALFGPNWNQRIVDVSDVFFVNYTLAQTPVSPTQHPNGMLVQYQGSSDIMYVYDNVTYLVTPSVFSANLFRNEFVVTDVNPALFSYSPGPNLPTFNVDVLMTLK
jgi:hypothetical protein